MEFRSKDSDLQASFKRIQKGTQGVATEADKATSAMSRIGGGLKSTAGAVGDVHTKLLGWGVAIAGALVGIQQVITAAREGAKDLQLSARIERMGLGEEVEALRTGLAGTLDDTTINQMVILLDRAKVSLEDIGVIGEYARVEAARSGKQTAEVLRQIAEAFSTGELAGLRMGKDVGSVMARMRMEVSSAAHTIGGDFVERLDQISASQANFWSAVNVTIAQLAVSASTSYDEMVKLHLAEKGIRGEEARLLLIREEAIEQVEKLELAHTAGFMSLEAYNEKVADLALAALRADDALEAYYRTQELGLSIARDLTTATDALAYSLGRVSTQGAAAALVLAGLQAGAQAGVTGATNAPPRPAGGRGGRSTGDPEAAAEYLRRQELGNAAAAALQRARVTNEGAAGGRGNDQASQGGMVDARGILGARDRNTLSAEDVASRETEMWRQRAEVWAWAGDQFAMFGDRYSQVAGSIAEAGVRMSMALSEGNTAEGALAASETLAKGLIKDGKWLAAFLAVLSAAKSVYYFAELDFWRGATYAAAAVALGGAAAWSGGRGGSGGSRSGQQGRGYVPPPDYSRRERTENQAPINIYITGPSLDSPQFRRVVTDAARQGAREGYTGSRL